MRDSEEERTDLTWGSSTKTSEQGWGPSREASASTPCRDKGSEKNPSPASRPNQRERSTKKNRRPDQQLYVPRSRRLAKPTEPESSSTSSPKSVADTQQRDEKQTPTDPECTQKASRSKENPSYLAPSNKTDYTSLNLVTEVYRDQAVNKASQKEIASPKTKSRSNPKESNPKKNPDTEIQADKSAQNWEAREEVELETAKKLKLDVEVTSTGPQNPVHIFDRVDANLSGQGNSTLYIPVDDKQYPHGTDVQKICQFPIEKPEKAVTAESIELQSAPEQDLHPAPQKQPHPRSHFPNSSQFVTPGARVKGTTKEATSFPSNKVRLQDTSEIDSVEEQATSDFDSKAVPKTFLSSKESIPQGSLALESSLAAVQQISASSDISYSMADDVATIKTKSLENKDRDEVGGGESPQQEVTKDGKQEKNERQEEDGGEKEGEAEEEDSWDTMFDDDGNSLKDDEIKEITDAVGGVSVTVKKPAHEFYGFSPKDNTDYSKMEHVIEACDFPASFQTQDLVMAFSAFKSKGFDIKWVDDTHALIVFSTPQVAQDALGLQNPMMRTRPLDRASKQSKDKAREAFLYLEPYKPRPETSSTTAKRMVAGALGIKSTVSKEERDKERQKLRQAKDKKREEKRQKADIWEGNI